eukprot:scaffold3819_cov107-Isochrysis_galbana.AAC.11
MAPRQLLLELEEVNMAAEKGPKRVSALTALMTAQCRRMIGVGSFRCVVAREFFSSGLKGVEA